MKSLMGVSLVCLLSALLWPEASASCSRLLSRRVRKFLQEDIFPRLPSSLPPEQLPSQCPLNPLHDIYLKHEEHKTSYGSKDFRCGYCGKHFVSDKYIDRHFDNKHGNTIEANRTTCLADLCPLFGCSEQNTHYKGSKGSGKFSKLQMCSDEVVERYKYKCEVLSKRCFGHLNDDKSSIALKDYFNTNVCKRLHCESGVLRGNLLDEEEDDDDEAGLFLNIMRWIVAFLVFGAITLYMCSAGTLSPFFSKSRVVDLDKSAGKRQGIFSSVMKLVYSKND